MSGLVRVLRRADDAMVAVWVRLFVPSEVRR